MTERSAIASGRACRGLTYIEMLVALAVLAILASAALPLARWDQKRRDEARLRTTLRTMRQAIDRYKDYADRGLILLSDVDQKNYPRSLEELVEGIEVGQPPEAQVVKFLGRIPVDPITGTTEWGLRSYQDDWDSRTWGGENVYDVYSLSEAQALDGTYYEDW
jgi:general secretion pathway protein G